MLNNLSVYTANVYCLYKKKTNNDNVTFTTISKYKYMYNSRDESEKGLSASLRICT